MSMRWMGLVALWAVAGLAAAQQGHGGAGQRYPYHYPGYGQQKTELTIEEQRKLGLTDEQIQKIAEQRRELEKDRARLEVQLKVAQQAAAAANAEVSRLNQDIRAILTTQLDKVYESVMTEAQLKAWKQQRYIDQAKQWLRSYTHWLKLTDAQVEDISALLVPVYEKYGKMEDQVADAREHLAELRRADKLDLAAIAKAEKDVAELSSQNIWRARHNEAMEKMRPGLLPDQLEKLDKMYRPQR